MVFLFANFIFRVIAIAVVVVSACAAPLSKQPGDLERQSLRSRAILPNIGLAVRDWLESSKPIKYVSCDPLSHYSAQHPFRLKGLKMDWDDGDADIPMMIRDYQNIAKHEDPHPIVWELPCSTTKHGRRICCSRPRPIVVIDTDGLYSYANALRKRIQFDSRIGTWLGFTLIPLAAIIFTTIAKRYDKDS